MPGEAERLGLRFEPARMTGLCAVYSYGVVNPERAAAVKVSLTEGGPELPLTALSPTQLNEYVAQAWSEMEETCDLMAIMSGQLHDAGRLRAEFLAALGVGVTDVRYIENPMIAMDYPDAENE